MNKVLLLSLLALGIGAKPRDDLQNLSDEMPKDSKEIPLDKKPNTSIEEVMNNGTMEQFPDNDTEVKKPPQSLSKNKDFLLNVGANLQPNDELSTSSTETNSEVSSKERTATTPSTNVKKEGEEIVTLMDENMEKEFVNGLKELRAKAREAAGYTDDDLGDDMASPIKQESKLYKDTEYFKEQIQQREPQLNKLKAELALAIKTENEEDTARIVTEMEKVFQEIETFEYFYSELKEFSLSVGKDLVDFDNKWKNKTVFDEFNSTMENEDALEASPEITEVNNEKVAHRSRRDLQGGVNYFEWAGCSLVPKFDDFIDEVYTLIPKAIRIGPCAENVNYRAGRIIDKFYPFQRVTSEIKTLKNGLVGLHLTLTFVSHLPYVGPVASSFKTVVGRFKNTVNNAYTRIESVENKFMATWSSLLGEVESYANYVSIGCKEIDRKADIVHHVSVKSRDEICSMNSSSLRNSKILKAENTTFSMLIAKALNFAFDRIAPVCYPLDSLLTRLDNALSHGIFDTISNGLNRIINALGPLIDIFGEIDSALNQELCIPNPLELTREAAEDVFELAKEPTRELGERAAEAINAENVREVGERAAEVGERAAEAINAENVREVGERVAEAIKAENLREEGENLREAGHSAIERGREGFENGREGIRRLPIIGRRRRRRSADIFFDKEKAHSFLDTRVSRVKRASSICFSVKDIITGIDSAFSVLVGFAKDILNEIMTRIPILNSLPSLPNFDIISKLLGILNLPNVDFSDLQFKNQDKNLEFLNLDLSLFKFD